MPLSPTYDGKRLDDSNKLIRYPLTEKHISSKFPLDNDAHDSILLPMPKEDTTNDTIMIKEDGSHPLSSLGMLPQSNTTTS